MRDEEILLEQVLGKVIEFLVIRAHAVRGRDAGNAGHFVHVLVMKSWLVTWLKDEFGRGTLFGRVERVERYNEKGGDVTTRVHEPANQVLFFPLMNIIPGTTRT